MCSTPTQFINSFVLKCTTVKAPVTHFLKNTIHSSAPETFEHIHPHMLTYNVQFAILQKFILQMFNKILWPVEYGFMDDEKD